MVGQFRIPRGQLAPKFFASRSELGLFPTKPAASARQRARAGGRGPFIDCGKDACPQGFANPRPTDIPDEGSAQANAQPMRDAAPWMYSAFPVRSRIAT
jgi:hypothetical protein